MTRLILGSILYLLFTSALVCAEDYYFDLHVTKKEIYKGESAVLEVRFFKKRGIGMVTGSFKPAKSDIFDFKEYELTNEIEGEYSIDRFVYLIKAKKDGRQMLSLFGEISIFSDEDARASSDHRDAMPLAATQKRRLSIGKIEFDIKKAGLNTIVGDFEIRTDLQDTSVIKNEPVHFEVVIEGEGDVDDIEFPQIKIENVIVFEQEPVKKSWIKEGRLYAKASKEYASVSDKSFEIPPIGLSFFSVKNAKDITKHTEAKSVSVRYDADIEASLLDKEIEQKGSGGVTFESVREYLFCAFVLILGFFFGRMKVVLKKKEKKNLFKEKIKNSKNSKELLSLLLPYVDDENLGGFINMLEDEMPQEKRFEEIKSLLLKKI